MSSDQPTFLLKDTTLKELMRLPLSAVKLVLVNAGRLLAATWRRQPGIVIAETLLSLLSACIPFLQSGIIALLINELVRTAGQGARSGCQRSLPWRSAPPFFPTHSTPGKAFSIVKCTS